MKYVILGGGAAGIAAAEAIRRTDAAGDITIFASERAYPYSRPMLTKTQLARAGGSEAPLFPPEWYAENRLELVRGATVGALDAEKKAVHVDGLEYGYDKCIYALGASSFIPPFPGADKAGVCAIRTWDDIRAIKRLALGAKTAVIIGGGVIGLEAALQLQEYGIKVTVLEALPHLMPRLIDEATSAALIERLDGMEILTGVKIAGITGEERADGVELDDGRRFACGFVIVTCGVRANAAIAAAAGIACGHAVKVNERMETNIADIYACGDCAEHDGINYALWSQAIEQGRVAGVNAAGGRASVETFDTSLVLNSARVSLFSAGDLGKTEGVDYTLEVSKEDGDGVFAINPRYAAAVTRRYYAGGRLVGASILGNLSGMYPLKRQILFGE